MRSRSHCWRSPSSAVPARCSTASPPAVTSAAPSRTDECRRRRSPRRGVVRGGRARTADAVRTIRPTSTAATDLPCGVPSHDRLFKMTDPIRPAYLNPLRAPGTRLRQDRCTVARASRGCLIPAFGQVFERDHTRWIELTCRCSTEFSARQREASRPGSRRAVDPGTARRRIAPPTRRRAFPRRLAEPPRRRSVAAPPPAPAPRPVEAERPAPAPSLSVRRRC